MFTIDDTVANTGSEPVTLYPYGLVSRHESPLVKAYYILHEGLIGVVDDGGSSRSPTRRRSTTRQHSFKSKHGLARHHRQILGDRGHPRAGQGRSTPNSPGRKADGRDRFQTDYLMGPLSVAPGETAETKGQVFAGAKEVNLVDGYAERSTASRNSTC